MARKMADLNMMNLRRYGVPWKKKNRRLDPILVSELERSCREFGRDSTEAKKIRKRLGISEPLKRK